MSELFDRLKGAVGAAGFVAGEDVGPRYFSDAAGHQGARPSLVLRPASTTEVSAILALCQATGQPLVPQGGMTGLVGAGLPAEGEVALSLERLNAIEEIDSESGTMTVGAGAVLQTIQEAALAKGFSFPLDLGARGSCTIGGNLATNAGGNRVIRYGVARELVLGLEAVLADGSVVGDLNKLIKNNTGYDLRQLFIGSEGTLGVITRVTLRLYPKPASQTVALCGLDDFAQVIRFLRHMQNAFSGGISAFEVMWQSYFSEALKVTGQRPPFADPHPFYALTEVLGGSPERDREAFEYALASAFDSGLINDAVVAKSLAEVVELWQLRDASSEVTRNLAPVLGYDVSIPASRMVAFAEVLTASIDELHPGNKTVIFGHVGDGNLHITTTAGASDPEQSDAVNNLVFKLTAANQGSISAEHGIGILKRPYLSYSRSEADITLMRTLKTALDPKGILSPGRIFEI
ncbi:MAG TPA: FAD-binding oxidoreductase [Alphaproteobacteria bacterium]|nr:FAD-binding oxidoreductase [Alphaproteobacteria bacterium]HJM50596.1 FAD-binding oxidoreductase [Alphaproteobacteria bacterium]